jgi:hypothetical protein
LFILQKNCRPALANLFSLPVSEYTDVFIFHQLTRTRTQAVRGSRSIHIKTDGGLPLINYSCARGNFFIIQVGDFSFSGGRRNWLHFCLLALLMRAQTNRLCAMAF